MIRDLECSKGPEISDSESLKAVKGLEISDPRFESSKRLRNF